MNAEAYLQRINFSATPTVNAETLRDLQVAHLLSVPFENLSIHANETIVLEDEALFTKIVSNMRGGFCYELNGLFAALLRTLGFDVVKLAAEVANAEGEFSQNFDHMALMVSLPGERWLVDVGFGDSFLKPLSLDQSGEQWDGRRAYKIISNNPHLTMMQRDNEGHWKPQYRFTLQPYEYADYEGMCRYHQTSPESHFTQGRICSLATAEGRITLNEMRFITTSGEHREERTLDSKEEYDEVLRDRFGIVM